MQTAYGHLTYCTNIHPGESWANHFAALKKHFPQIKKEISPGKPMGIGLRLSNEASLEILQGYNLLEFKAWLTEQHAYVFTMNGFPYGGFHHTRVKDEVHAPDWTTAERFDYTIRLFKILTELLPEGMEGGVSTSPLSYRYWFDTPEKLATATKHATANMLDVVETLVHIKNQTGKILHLDIEPEPDGILESGPEFINWYEQELLPAAALRLGSSAGMENQPVDQAVKAHIRICYDVCHFAIGYEPHLQIIKALSARGILIGKIQVSAALKADLPADTMARREITDTFAKFDEPTYLHQVVAFTENGALIRYRDLPQAIADADNPEVKAWRAHFHVPVFEERFGLLQSTRSDIETLLAIHRDRHITDHVEVETYTWTVLDDALKAPIADSIIRELAWTIKCLK